MTPRTSRSAHRRMVVANMALGIALMSACDRQPTTPRYRLTVEPETLAFAAREGGLPPIPRYVTVTGTILGNWSVASDAPWLAVSPPSGYVPRSVVVAPDNRGLAIGTYRGTLTFTESNASGPPVHTTVTLEIATRSPLAGRWVGAWSTLVLSLDLQDSLGTVVGSGLLSAGRVPVTVTGTRTGDNIALSLRPVTGAPIALNAYFFYDHVMRGALNGGAFAGDSVLLFRQ